MLQRSHHVTDLTKDLVVVMGKEREKRDSEEEGERDGGMEGWRGRGRGWRGGHDGRDFLKGVRMAFGG